MEEEVGLQTRASWGRELTLESLETRDYSSSYLPRLTTFFPVFDLKRVSLGGVNSDAMIPLTTIVRSCATTLEALSLGFIGHTDGGTEGTCFSRLPFYITLSLPFHQPPCCALTAGSRPCPLSVF